MFQVRFSTFVQLYVGILEDFVIMAELILGLITEIWINLN